MAQSTVDISIDELAETLEIGDADLWVIQQNGEAFKISGGTVKAWLFKLAQAHGMISDISQVSSAGLVDTYRITLSDGTTYDFDVTNGSRGYISSVNEQFPDESGNIQLQPSDIGALPTTGGVLTGDLKMNGHRVTGLSDPAEDTQAATKKYVDSACTKLLASYTGETLSLGLPANTITHIDIYRNLQAGGLEFEDSGDGGAVMPADGIVQVSASVYFRSNTSTGNRAGVYIYKNGATSADGGTEVASTYIWQQGQGCVGLAPALVKVNAGDVLYLAARTSTDQTCSPGSDGTYLNIVYM